MKKINIKSSRANGIRITPGPGAVRSRLPDQGGGRLSRLDLPPEHAAGAFYGWDGVGAVRVHT